MLMSVHVCNRLTLVLLEVVLYCPLELFPVVMRDNGMDQMGEQILS